MDRAALISPLDGVSWPRGTSELTLRPAVPGDAAAVFAYRRLESVARWLSQIQSDPVVWAERWGLRVPTTIVVESDGRLIGDMRIVPGDAHAQAEVIFDAIGTEAEMMWAFDPAFHGRGYASEAIRALIAIGFNELGLRRLTARCYAGNIPSWRLMEQIGMRREGHSVRSTLHRDGAWHDLYDYALLAPGA